MWFSGETKIPTGFLRNESYEWMEKEAISITSKVQWGYKMYEWSLFNSENDK